MNPSAILQALRNDGWVRAIGKPREIGMALTMAGLTAAPVQRGASRQILRPTTAEEAPVQSLSAHFGLQAQPLHTDGAHLQEPPDVVLLYSAQPNSTPTMVWPSKQGRRTSYPDCVRFGIFTVRNGRKSFMASAIEGFDRVRFDPVCMSPADGYARDAVVYFSNLQSVAHQWDEPDTVLILDNRRCLHARSAVVSGDEGREIERLTFRWEVTA